MWVDGGRGQWGGGGGGGGGGYPAAAVIDTQSLYLPPFLKFSSQITANHRHRTGSHKPQTEKQTTANNPQLLCIKIAVNIFGSHLETFIHPNSDLTHSSYFFEASAQMALTSWDASISRTILELLLVSTKKKKNNPKVPIFLLFFFA